MRTALGTIGAMVVAFLSAIGASALVWWAREAHRARSEALFDPRDLIELDRAFSAIEAELRSDPHEG